MLRRSLLVAALACGCGRPSETASEPLASALPQAVATQAEPRLPHECPPVDESPAEPPPPWVARLATTDLYVRVTTDAGRDLVVAPAEDLAVVRAYPTSGVRGAISDDGMRITLLSAKRTYRTNEEIRVIHVVEVLAPGRDVFVMGPKPVTGELLDDRLVTDPVPAWGAFTMGVYDGAVMKSPWADANYEITRYVIPTPGVHRIQWRAGTVSSNELCIRVIP